MQTNTELFFQWAAPLALDLDAARESILISALSLHPMRKVSASNIGRLWLGLAGAVARGVAVDFILPAPARSHPATAINGQAAEALHAIGARCHFAPPARLLHAKTAVIDRATVWIGSGNWTAAATAHNHEAYLRITCNNIAERVRANWRAAGFIGA